MELKNIKNSHKKPAMALVLIIIIITSLTVVIMGTVKIITSTSGRYSINRNAKGVLNIKKPLGRYICFMYGDKLYQSTVLYNSDGSIADGYPVIEPASGATMDNCTFKIPDGVSYLNFTLVGGGAAGGLQYYDGLKYIRDKEYKNGETISEFLKDNGYKLSWKYLYDGLKFDPTVIYDSKSPESYSNTVNKDNIIKNICCYGNLSRSSDNSVCYPNKDEAKATLEDENNAIVNNNLSLLYGENCPVSVSPLTFESKFEGNIYWYLEIPEIRETFQMFDDYLPEGNKTPAEFIKEAVEKIAYKICIYKPYISYASLKASKPGDVQKSSILVSELEDGLESFTFCKNNGSHSVCDGYVGLGDTYISTDTNNTITKLNLKFKDANTSQPRPTNPAEKNNSYKNIMVEELSGNIERLRDIEGQEADYELSEDFGIKSNTTHNFDLHKGYFDTNTKSATLFGASGVVLKPTSTTGEICSKDNSNMYKTISSEDSCPPENGTGSCNALKNTSQNLSGGPGAIIIEW